MTRRNDERERDIYIYRERERKKEKERRKWRGRKDEKKGDEGATTWGNLCLRTRRPRRGREGGERARPRPTKSEARREKIELNWGQIDSSRESLHSIWRLPNRVRLTPFKTFNGPSWKVLKDARVEPS